MHCSGGQAEDVVAGLKSGLVIHQSCVAVDVDTLMFCDCSEVKHESLRKEMYRCNFFSSISSFCCPRLLYLQIWNIKLIPRSTGLISCILSVALKTELAIQYDEISLSGNTKCDTIDETVYIVNW